MPVSPTGNFNPRVHLVAAPIVSAGLLSATWSAQVTLLVSSRRDSLAAD
jgi:hypothetical protein